MPTENIDYADKSTGDNFTAGDANDIKSAVNTNAALQFVNAPVLESLPDTDATKAGELFYYNGTLWTYARAGQFGTLAEGTPWPVKGYKEFEGLVTQSTTNAPTVTTEAVNEIGTVSTNRLAVGSYSLTFSGESLSEQDLVLISNADSRLVPNLSANIDVSLFIDAIDFSGTTADGFAAYVQVKLYPPQS